MAKTTLVNLKTGFKSQFSTEDNKSVLHTTQDVSGIIKHAQHLGEQKAGKDFRHVAEIPMVIYEKALLEGWANDDDKWKQWLNNRDNECFRSWKGKV